MRNEFNHLGNVLFTFQNVNFVYNNSDFLAPVSYAFQEDALTFGERAIRRGNKEHEIGARDEIAGDGFVLAVNGIRTRRVYDVDFLEELHRGGDDFGGSVVGRLAVVLFAVLQKEDALRGGGDTFLQNGRAQKSIDEGALSGIELPNDHQQKQLVELKDGLLQGGLILRGRVQTSQGDTQIAKQAAFFCLGALLAPR